MARLFRNPFYAVSEHQLSTSLLRETKYATGDRRNRDALTFEHLGRLQRIDDRADQEPVCLLRRMLRIHWADRVYHILAVEFAAARKAGRSDRNLANLLHPRLRVLHDLAASLHSDCFGDSAAVLQPPIRCVDDRVRLLLDEIAVSDFDEVAVHVDAIACVRVERQMCHLLKFLDDMVLLDG